MGARKLQTLIVTSSELGPTFAVVMMMMMVVAVAMETDRGDDLSPRRRQAIGPYVSLVAVERWSRRLGRVLSVRARA